MEGQMRVSVVATGIEAREIKATATATGDAKPVGAPQPATTPSFRLRPQSGKAPIVPSCVTKPATAPAPVAARAGDEPGDRAARRDSKESAGKSAEPGGEGESARPEPVPAGAEAVAAERRSVEPGRPGEPSYQPLRPEERFQEWGKLRAPVREFERPPSLFERVAHFAGAGRHRAERPQTSTEPVLAGGEPAERQLAAAEEDVYEIPAFLRR
jgi:cell division protein FtsZ